MVKNRRPKRKNTNNNAVNKPYNGPYQNNPNMHFEQVRKNMETPVDGPTAETFSYSDSTTLQYSPENSANPQNKHRPKSKRKKVKNWWSEHWKETIISGVCTIVFSGIGIIVFSHSNHLVAVDKDVENMKEDISNNSQEIKNIDRKTYDVDKKVDLLEQKIDLSLKFESLPSSKILERNGVK